MLGVNPKTKRQKEDFYATDPKALEIFIDKLQKDNVYLREYIWECACGMGHLSRVLEKRGYKVTSTDLVYRGYGEGGIDFLTHSSPEFYGDILTNPPFKLAEKFVKKGMEKLQKGNRLLLFLKIQFLEGQRRKKLFEKYPPKYVYVYSARQLCSRNGEFEKYKATTQCFAWFIWEKGYQGETIVRWI